MAKQNLSSEEIGIQNEIINGLNKLRKEQTYFSRKISELEFDMREHELVMEELKAISDKSRPCYRLISGVLIKRTVGEVYPSLEKSIENMKNFLDVFNKAVVEKGKQINEYIKKYGIKIVVDDKLHQDSQNKNNEIDSKNTIDSIDKN